MEHDQDAEMRCPFLPLNATTEDATIAVASFYVPDLSAILEVMVAGGMPAGDAEMKLEIMIGLLSDYLGIEEPGRLRRWWARVGCVYFRLRRGVFPREGDMHWTARVADLFVHMHTERHIRRHRIAPILHAALRQVSVERQVETLMG